MKTHAAATLLGFFLLLLTGRARGQEPALTAKGPIHLTKVEGRMDHLGVDVKGLVPDLGEVFETIPHRGAQAAEILVYGTK